MNAVIALAIFIAVLCVIEGGALLLKATWDPQTKRLKNQLKGIADVRESQAMGITRSRPLSGIPWLNNLLQRIPLVVKLDDILVQANSRYPVGIFILLSLIMALIGVLLASVLIRNPLISVVGVFLGFAPFGVADVRKKRRMKKFEDQLPEALELMARSLRAGHAFAGGLQMVAQEFEDPIGTEFGKTLAQISLGVSTEQALKNLTQRVDCPDLKFLTVSVLIQRETGGNLAEIMDNIGRLIRERFKLRGRIRTLSAEGRLSAGILVAIPIFLAVIISFINPGYIGTLGVDPAGKILVGVAVAMMIIGIFLMKRMIAIRV